MDRRPAGQGSSASFPSAMDQGTAAAAATTTTTNEANGAAAPRRRRPQRETTFADLWRLLLRVYEKNDRDLVHAYGYVNEIGELYLGDPERKVACVLLTNEPISSSYHRDRLFSDYRTRNEFHAVLTLRHHLSGRELPPAFLVTTTAPQIAAVAPSHASVEDAAPLAWCLDSLFLRPFVAADRPASDKPEDDRRHSAAIDQQHIALSFEAVRRFISSSHSAEAVFHAAAAPTAAVQQPSVGRSRPFSSTLTAFTRGADDRCDMVDHCAAEDMDNFDGDDDDLDDGGWRATMRTFGRRRGFTTHRPCSDDDDDDDDDDEVSTGRRDVTAVVDMDNADDDAATSDGDSSLCAARHMDNFKRVPGQSAFMNRAAATSRRAWIMETYKQWFHELYHAVGRLPQREIFVVSLR